MSPSKRAPMVSVTSMSPADHNYRISTDNRCPTCAKYATCAFQAVCAHPERTISAENGHITLPSVLPNRTCDLYEERQ